MTQTFYCSARWRAETTTSWPLPLHPPRRHACSRRPHKRPLPCAAWGWCKPHRVCGSGAQAERRWRRVFPALITSRDGPRGARSAAATRCIWQTPQNQHRCPANLNVCGFVDSRIARHPYPKSASIAAREGVQHTLKPSEGITKGRSVRTIRRKHWPVIASRRWLTGDCGKQINRKLRPLRCPLCPAGITRRLTSKHRETDGPGSPAKTSFPRYQAPLIDQQPRQKFSIFQPSPSFL